MNIQKTVKNNLNVIAVSGRLDSNTSPDLETFIGSLEDTSCSGIILDMTELDYISSAGLRVILNTSKSLKRNAKSFSLCKVQDHIREVFEISGFDMFIDIHPSLQIALDHK